MSRETPRETRTRARRRERTTFALPIKRHTKRAYAISHRGMRNDVSDRGIDKCTRDTVEISAMYLT
jgi:hypothetical protein